jgi:predicted Zn-dependent peptidase
MQPLIGIYEKIREQVLADIKSFWDEPSSFAGQLVRNIIYKGHPYSVMC